MLSSVGIIDRETADIAGLSISTVKRWRRESFATTSYRRASCPRSDGRALDRRAYAYLLGLYLGDGHIARARTCYVLVIFCADAWPGLRGEAEAALRAVMPSSGVCRVAKIGCTQVKSYSNHWPCLFPQHGAGRKHERSIDLEPWQQEIVAEFPGDFARGLIHSDGSRIINRVRKRLRDRERWYEYSRYFFSNESSDILGLCGEALDRLGVAWRFSRRNAISVARRDAVARLDEFVGPKY